jgi:soluble lytic murein transglycosylase-like protein
MLHTPTFGRWMLVAVAPVLCCAAALADEARSDRALIASMRAEATAYQYGEGVPKDVPRALELFCSAARRGDAESQFDLGWIHAHGQGVPRNDSLAAFFFAAAAEQGIGQARQMLQLVGSPEGAIPECMREPEPPPAPPAPVDEAPAARPFQIQTKAPKALIDLVQKMAPQYRVEPQLALAIMEVESNFDSAAVSPKNAMGLMQLVPETAARFNVRNAFDPIQSVRGGLAYLRWLLAYFEGDLTLVAAAYNAGEGTVERYRGVPPYAETRGYVRRIVEAVGATQHPFDAKVTAPSSQLPRIRASKDDGSRPTRHRKSS